MFLSLERIFIDIKERQGQNGLSMNLCEQAPGIRNYIYQDLFIITVQQLGSILFSFYCFFSFVLFFKREVDGKTYGPLPLDQKVNILSSWSKNYLGKSKLKSQNNLRWEHSAYFFANSGYYLMTMFGIFLSLFLRAGIDQFKHFHHTKLDFSPSEFHIVASSQKVICLAHYKKC